MSPVIKTVIKCKAIMTFFYVMYELKNKTRPQLLLTGWKWHYLRITHLILKAFIHWVVTYLADIAVHPLNKWGQVVTYNYLDAVILYFKKKKD